MFLNYINNFRGIAIIYVVTGHSISAFDWKNAPHIERIAKILFSNGTVFFVFIAGYLFQYLVKNYDTKKYFMTKSKYVLLPYFLISLPAVVYFVYFQHREGIDKEFYNNPQWLQVVYFYISGSHLASLWFIPMMTVLYLLSPLLVILDKKEWIYSAIPLAILISCIFAREGGVAYIPSLHFFSAYLLGMFFSHYGSVINTVLIKQKSLIMLILISTMLIVIEYYMTDKTMSFLNFLNKLILCGFFIGTLIVLDGKFNDKYLKILADTSFGIFFIHSYVIKSFKIITIKNAYLQGNLYLLTVVTLLVLIISSTIVVMVKKMLGTNSRYLIGS